jgi:hypothetical protein
MDKTGSAKAGGISVARCVTLLRGAQRLVLLSLRDGQRGGEWKGKVFNASDREFKIDSKQVALCAATTGRGSLRSTPARTPNWTVLDHQANPQTATSFAILAGENERGGKRRRLWERHWARHRRVKIIATLEYAGRASPRCSPLSAVSFINEPRRDVMRGRVAMIREVEEETGRPIGVLVDLQGRSLGRHVRRRAPTLPAGLHP